MQFTTLSIIAFSALTSAAALKRAPIDLCPALDTPQCCQADVDGVLALTCESRTFQRPPEVLRRKRRMNGRKDSKADFDRPTASDDPETSEEFAASCASSGLTAQCCTLPVVCFCLLSLLLSILSVADNVMIGWRCSPLPRSLDWEVYLASPHLRRRSDGVDNIFSYDL